MVLGPRQQYFISMLRSGKFQQITNKLARKDRITGEFCYCAEGLLCECAIELGLYLKVEITDNLKSYEGNTSDAPDYVRYFFQLKLPLIGLNDIYRLSFKQIADELENNSDKYFAMDV